MANDSRRRLLTPGRLIALLASLLLLSILAAGIAWYRDESSSQTELAKLRAAGFPTTGRELNAFYVVPKGVPDASLMWVLALDGLTAARLQGRYSNLPVVGTGTAPIPSPGEPWEQLDDARQFLVDIDTEVQRIRQAVAIGGQVRFPVDFSLGLNANLNNTQRSREAARLLTLDAHVSAHDKKHEQALEDVRAIFTLSDALRGEPTIISQLVRMAIHGIGCNTAAQLMPYCPWTDAQLEELQKLIQSARFKEEMVRAIIGERALCLTALDEMPLGPIRLTNVREALRVFDISITACGEPWREVIARQRALSAELVAAVGAGFIERVRRPVRMILPALEPGAIAGARAHARQNAAVAALAVRRFQQRYQRLPETLAEVEGLIPKSSADETGPLIDPLDGQSLRYKVKEKRYVIYSVGDDGADDGGDVPREDGTSGQPRDVGVAIKR